MKRLGFIIRMAIILLFFFCLSIFLVINTSPLFYWLMIRWLKLTSRVHLSQVSLMRCYISMINYLQNPWESRLKLLYFYSSSRGLHHFLDVKRLFMINNFGLLLLGILFIYVLSINNFSFRLWRLIIFLKMSLSTLWVMLVMVMINFQSSFITFHRFLFRDQDWVFHPSSDPVILALPLPFFVLCFIVASLIYSALIEGLIHWSRQRINCLDNVHSG